jgi:hypothetical protein
MKPSNINIDSPCPLSNTFGSREFEDAIALAIRACQRNGDLFKPFNKRDLLDAQVPYGKETRIAYPGDYEFMELVSRGFLTSTPPLTDKGFTTPTRHSLQFHDETLKRLRASKHFVPTPREPGVSTFDPHDPDADVKRVLRNSQARQRERNLHPAAQERGELIHFLVETYGHEALAVHYLANLTNAGLRELKETFDES